MAYCAPNFVGTDDTAYIWCNYTDTLGLVCSTFVWLSFLFVLACSIYFYAEGYFNAAEFIISLILELLSIWSHLKVALSDPGAVPKDAQPAEKDRHLPYTMCGRCDAYKPPKSHHDRVSNRCVSRMDHYCPWTNNAIGAKNQKAFILFIIYTDISGLYLYYLIAVRLLICTGTNCRAFEGAPLILARILIFLLVFGVMFTTSMILNQVYGLATGLGTIDRMKLKKDDTPDEDPIPAHHVFGSNYYAYCLPIDAKFHDDEEVLRYKLDNTLTSSV